jgi:class 3 adenylate cyclase
LAEQDPDHSGDCGSIGINGLAIHRKVVEVNEKLHLGKPCLPPLRLRAGILTGPVVGGILGNDLLKYSPTGSILP